METNFFDIDLRAKTWDSAYRARNYKADRDEMIRQLGGRCACCGSTYKLELDHIKPNGGKPLRQMARWTRIKHYRRQLKKKNLQVLCHTCNVRKGNHYEPSHV